ncbi:hypothetical protein BGZ47_010179, partial [Haplosporangium gracile]
RGGERERDDDENEEESKNDTVRKANSEGYGRNRTNPEAKDSRPECLDEAGQPEKRLTVANAAIQAEAAWKFNMLLVREEDLTKDNRNIDELKEKWKYYAFSDSWNDTLPST